MEATVTALLSTLAKDPARFRNKRERREQRAAFRDFLSGFEVCVCVYVYGFVCICFWCGSSSNVDVQLLCALCLWAHCGRPMLTVGLMYACSYSGSV
jgi:hypothetical protein